jgi:hypothetical protein
MHLRRIGGGKGAPKTIGLISEPLVFGDPLKRRASDGAALPDAPR